jgi:hypothetical protein
MLHQQRTSHGGCEGYQRHAGCAPGPKPWLFMPWKHQKHDNFVGPLLHLTYPSGHKNIPKQSKQWSLALEVLERLWHETRPEVEKPPVELRWSTWSTDRHKLGWNPWIHVRGFLKMRDPDNSSRLLILFTLVWDPYGFLWDFEQFPIVRNSRDWICWKTMSNVTPKKELL